MVNIKLSKYEQAQERVLQLKKFYNHATAYVIINVFLFIKVTLVSEEVLGNHGFLNWIDWNVFGTTIVWGVILMFHAIKVFRNITLLGKNWEERQIEKYMNEERTETDKYKELGDGR